MCMIWGLTAWSPVANQQAHPWDDEFSLSQAILVACSSLLRHGDPGDIPLLPQHATGIVIVWLLNVFIASTEAMRLTLGIPVMLL